MIQYFSNTSNQTFRYVYIIREVQIMIAIKPDFYITVIKSRGAEVVFFVHMEVFISYI